MSNRPPVTIPGCQFSSDNAAGICPEVWSALESANAGYSVAYGDDPTTEKAIGLVRDLFETDCQVYFTFNGTAANALSLAAICQSHHGVLCADISHVQTDECGAPGFFTGGAQLLPVETDAGKLTPAVVQRAFCRRDDVHAPKARALSITQSTEWGSVYDTDELRGLCDLARRLNLCSHMDGARLANAMATLGIAAKSVTWEAGVDVVCLGATKTGAPVGDAVVFFNSQLAEEFEYRCKQAGQLASKMRYLSAGWIGLLQSGAWLKYARHSNQCAQQIADRLLQIRGIRLVAPRQANAVLVDMPATWTRRLRELGWKFYTFIGETGVRLMCSWSTRQEEIDALIQSVERVAADEPTERLE